MKKLIFALLLLPFTSHAGMWIEPGIGAEMSSYKFADTSTPPISFTGSGVGPAVDLKAGYIFGRGFTIGLDVDYGTHKYKPAESTDPEYDVTRTIAGVHLGYYSFMGFRAYATYGLSSSLTFKPTAGGDNIDFKEPTAFKVGIGYAFARYCAVNLEYMSYKPKKFVSGPVDVDVATIYSKTDFTSSRLMISFPFE